MCNASSCFIFHCSARFSARSYRYSSLSCVEFFCASRSSCWEFFKSIFIFSFSSLLTFISPTATSRTYFFILIIWKAFSLSSGDAGNPSLYGTDPLYFSLHFINSVIFLLSVWHSFTISFSFLFPILSLCCLNSCSNLSTVLNILASSNKSSSFCKYLPHFFIFFVVNLLYDDFVVSGLVFANIASVSMSMKTPRWSVWKFV